MARPTRALLGWAGGPGFALLHVDMPENDPSPRSPWQLAEGAWQDSGISWQRPQAERIRDDYPPHPVSGQSRPSTPCDSVPASTRPDAPPRHARTRPPEPDELFRAWQGSVRQASARSKLTARRRRQGWRLLRAGLPIAVIVTVGAGAVLMLMGKTNEVLADRARHGSPAPGTKGIGGSATRTGTFDGYPGQHGTVMVSSIASAGGTLLAVGSADGHPAVWRRAVSGAWTLVSARSPAIYQRPGAERLTSVAHGPAGWIAVGGVVSGAAPQPVVLTSADGVTWRALDSAATFAGSGNFVMAVTSGPDGYVVVGKRMSRGRTFAAMWWSADLRSWIMGHNGGLDGRLQPSTVYAVAALPAGFIAAGTHGHCHSVWTSADGKTWRVHDVIVPPGATSALLNVVAVNRNLVAAAGYAVLKDGDVPIFVLSADGGEHWRQIVLATPGTFGLVTTLTAAGSGFVAAGLAGPAAAQHAVTWSSPDGQTWSAATEAGLGTRQITALTAFGHTVAATVQRGADPILVTLPAP